MELFGYKIFKKNRPDTVFFNKKKSFLSIFDGNEKLSIFDIGANVGQSYRFFRSIFSRADICCFEPTKDAFKQLENATKDDAKAKAYQIAFGSTAGELELFTYPDSHQNSVFALNKDALSLKNNLHKDVPAMFEVPVQKQSCPLARLDTFCATNGYDKIDILKIDVQCYEDEVLLGATELLASEAVGVIMLEIIFEDVYNRPLSFGKIESIIAPYGYVLYDIAHIYKDLNINRTCFVDAIYISKKLFEKKKTKLYPALQKEDM